MVTALILLGARHGDSGVALVVLIIVVPILLLVVAATQAKESRARYNVVLKGGVPYCPECNRQVTYRRGYCRCCGHKYKFYESPAPEAPRKKYRNYRAERVCKEEAAKARLELQVRREEEYRAKGVEPGPWAWFQVLPLPVQALLIGIPMAVPIILVIVALFHGFG